MHNIHLKYVLFLTIIWMATSINANNNETYSIKFELNYAEAINALPPIEISHNGVINLESKPIPTREGYRFAGWYTHQECLPEQEWLFGYQAGQSYLEAAVDSMSVKESMILFARWVSPTYIKDVDGLNAIRNDLYGWYILENDIDLSRIADWNPIGDYESSYEYANGEWWKNAFKGKLDGNGYTISNLNLTNPNKTIKALFSSAVNAEICNLTIKDCHVSIASPSIYVAPLIGILKEDGGNNALITNNKIINAQIDVTLLPSESSYSAVTALIGGVWNGTIKNCHADGQINVSAKGINGGDIYIGGIIGETYCRTICCSSNLKTTISIQESKPKLFIGGLQASATDINNSIADGMITFRGCDSIKELNIGGITGSERYGKIQNCASNVDLIVENVSKVQIGGIVGEFNSFFGGIGPLVGFSVTEISHSYASGKIHVENIDAAIVGGISGSGKPDTLKGMWGGKMNYQLKNCIYVAHEGITLIDESIDSLYSFPSIQSMKGTTMQSILDAESNNGNWQYSNILPVPTMYIME